MQRLALDERQRRVRGGVQQETSLGHTGERGVAQRGHGRGELAPHGMEIGRRRASGQTRERDQIVDRTDWSRYSGLPLFRAANRMNASNTYLLMDREGEDTP